MCNQPALKVCSPTVLWKRFLIVCALAVAGIESHASTINWYIPDPNSSIARNWGERILESVRMDTRHPPAQARNLFSYSVCMYDAWAAYESNAVGFVYRGKHT